MKRVSQAVRLGAAGAAGGAGEELEDVGLLASMVVAGDDALEGAGAEAGLGETEAVAELGEGGVDHGHGAVGDGVGRHGAAGGVAGDADDAVLAEFDVEREAAGVVETTGALASLSELRTSEDAGDGGVGGGGLGQVEAGGGAVRVVAHVDGDLAGVGVDVDFGLEGDAVGDVGEGVQGGLGVDVAFGELSDAESATRSQ